MEKKLRIDILSLFPSYFRSAFGESILKRAQEKELLEIQFIDIRDFSSEKRAEVDDRPYGGGPGMVLMAEPVVKAIRNVREKDSHVVYLSPQGKTLNREKCKELSDHKHLILLCGHYEGIDERAIELEVDEEISIGDYVLTSGAPAAIVLVDSVARFVPGVVGNADAVYQDTFEMGVFDCPHYTRPRVFEGKEVPEVLCNGDHAKIDKWRKEKGYAKTKRVRPDLVKNIIGEKE